MIIPINTNLYSTITIFKHSILTKDKNFALDKNGSDLAIEEYLSTLESEQFTNCQYVKQGLSVVIKLNKSQETLNLIEANDWNYCKVQNDKERACYYFVVKKEWLSKETIAISLVMDTLNNFAFNQDYIVNKKTTIQRQHKDRIKYLGDVIGSRLGITSRYVLPTTYGEPYTYPIGTIFSGTFTPGSSGAKEFIIQYGYEVADPLIPEPTDWNDLPPELEPFWDEDTGTFGVKVVGDFTKMGSEVYTKYYLQFIIKPKIEYFCRSVDLVSEGFNVPVYKEELGEIQDTSNSLKWYLLYRNRDNPNPEEQFNDSPVECYLIPEKSVNITINTSTKLLTTGNITSGKYYVFDSEYDSGKEENAQFKIGDKTFTLSEQTWPETPFEYARKIRYVLVISSDGSQLSYQYIKMYKVYSPTATPLKQIINSGTLPAGTNIEVIYPYASILPYVSTTDPYTWLSIDDYIMPDESDRISFTASTSTQSGNISTLDRTDSRNIKLIALPYCPVQTSLDTYSRLLIENNFTYDSTTGWYKSNDITSTFKNTFLTGMKSPLSELLMKNLDLSEEYDRNDYLESKLLHSDFYRPKFVYDSFNYTYCLERYDYSKYLEDHPLFPDLDYYVTFVMTRTINSKFLFQFDTEYLTHSMDDYDGVVCVSRNNEEVLFNSAYINYVRSGFNYDKKSLARRQETAGWTIGLSVASAVLGIIGSVATQNPLPAVLGIAGAGVGITSQIVSNIQTQAQGEQTIQQKLEEANRQAVAVSGSDDVDLLTAYSNNKAKLVLYQVSERMKKLIGDLFYYCGYKLELQDIPDKDSRYWFNFVQCDLVVNYDTNLPSDMMNDLIERFKQGVTFFHYHNGFDLAQEKENLEISLVNR